MKNSTFKPCDKVTWKPEWAENTKQQELVVLTVKPGCFVLGQVNPDKTCYVLFGWYNQSFFEKVK